MVFSKNLYCVYVCGAKGGIGCSRKKIYTKRLMLTIFFFQFKFEKKKIVKRALDLRLPKHGSCDFFYSKTIILRSLLKSLFVCTREF